MFKKTKSSLLFATVFLSVFLLPGIGTVNAQSGDGGYNMAWDSMSNDQIADMPNSLGSALGSIFGMLDGIGPSGAALGQVFELMFRDIADLSIIEEDDQLDHVYTFNGSYTETESWTEDWGNSEFQGNNNDEIYWLWNDDVIDYTGNGWPYVEVSRTGTVNITHEYGAAMVFIIWDNDDSLITAIQKIMDAVKSVLLIFETMGDPNGWTEAQSVEAISLIVNEILSAITWLLFHINDIINGDELIVTNIITWDSYQMNTSADYETNKAVKIYDDWNWENHELVDQSTVDGWRSSAQSEGDDFLEWLLTNETVGAQNNREWSDLSFNLIEIWLKNFEVHINAGAIIDAISGIIPSQSDPFDGLGLAAIFEGVDIDIYIMTHSLLGYVAYNDTNSDLTPTVIADFANSTDNSTEYIIDSEVLYYFAMGEMGTPTFNQPSLDGEGGLSWDLTMPDVELAAIPLGMNARDMDSGDIVFDEVEEIKMGFTFTPKVKETVSSDGYNTTTLVPDYDTVQMAKGIVKLDQSFGEWGSVNPALNGLDFSVIFVSTIIHFHLNIVVEENPDLTDDDFSDQAVTGTEGVLREESFTAEGAANMHGSIKVGDAQIQNGEETAMPVARVDIAGPEYIQDQGGLNEATYNASTCTIPLAMMDFGASASVDYMSEDPSNSFSAEGVLEVETSILIYAVNYYSWDGTGESIWHDPTFSVFMTWDNPGFWAVILVIGGVTLVAVAAIMITKRKNRM
jgi:hypothetical protein